MTTLSVADVLDRAADLLEQEGCWGQGGKGDLHGACHCASTAMDHVHPDNDADAAQRFFADLVNPRAGLSIIRIWEWNDTEGRTQAEVVQTLRDAATLSRSSENRNG